MPTRPQPPASDWRSKPIGKVAAIAAPAGDTTVLVLSLRVDAKSAVHFSPCLEQIDYVIQIESILFAIGAQRIRGRSQTRRHRRSHIRPRSQGPQRKLLSADREKNCASGWERPQDLPFASQPKIPGLNGATDSWWAGDV